MFGEYAQIASYMPPSRDQSSSGYFPSSNLPYHLLPTPFSPQPPWPGGGTGLTRRGIRIQDTMDDRGHVEDFVMVAEFSEIEGPKPVLTIPKDAGGSVDKNSLSVKLMAVDHQTTSEGFSISEDTQVVLSDDECGVSAFVHHFVLYDNQARGFVRPYCMVFISSDIRKIMMMYEDLSSQFKRAARFLKYGNRLLFVKDLERHLQDLEHTKGYLLNQVARVRFKDMDGPDGEQSKSRSNAENELHKGLQNISQSSTELKDILSTLKPILHDRRLESRFRALEERAFQQGNEEMAKAEKLSLQENYFADNIYSDGPASVGGSLKDSHVSPVSLFKPTPSHTPLLVETKKAKRFNSPLRGLHELCSWGAKEGLRKLRCIHEYFKKDAMVLELERNESRLMEPANSMIVHGHCVTSNVLTGVLMRGSSLCVSEDSSSLLMSGDRLNRWPSIASDDTLESFKSVDSYMSIQDEEENASVYSFVSNNSSNGGVTTSASAGDFISAPTSPMTEEVAFPSSSPSTTLAPTLTTLSPSPSDSTDLSTGGLQHGNTQSSNTVIVHSSAVTHSNLAESVDSFDIKILTSDAEATSNHTNNTLDRISQLNIDACSGQTEANGHSSEFTDSSVDCRKCNQSCDEITQNVPCSGQEDSGYIDSQTAVIQTEESSELYTGQSVLKSTQSDTLARNSSVSPDLNSEEIDMENGSISGSRMPSFVPIRGLNTGRNVREVQGQNDTMDGMSTTSSLDNMGEELASRLEHNRMELTGSFKSVTDSYVSHTDESCYDTDGICNTLAGSTPSSESCSWKPRNGVYTSGDVMACLGPGLPGHGIHQVLMTYQNLHPVVFSLMTGRTVLVIGPARMEMEVIKIVTALSVFLPDNKRKQHCVVDWMNRPLKVTDLTRIRLAGICRSEKRSLDATIPMAVKQYSTLMDVERRVIMGPLYHGTVLNSVLQQKKSFRTDAEHVAFIHSWLMELSNKAFIFYHSFCLGEAGGLIMHHSVEKHREQYSATICCLMNRLGVRDHDICIVEHMVEKIKLSQIETHIWANTDKGSIVHPLTVTSRGCQTLRC